MNVVKSVNHSNLYFEFATLSRYIINYTKIKSKVSLNGNLSESKMYFLKPIGFNHLYMSHMKYISTNFNFFVNLFLKPQLCLILSYISSYLAKHSVTNLPITSHNPTEEDFLISRNVRFGTFLKNLETPLDCRLSLNFSSKCIQRQEPRVDKLN